jgi:hypothetical protein
MCMPLICSSVGARIFINNLNSSGNQLHNKLESKHIIVQTKDILIVQAINWVELLINLHHIGY